MRKLIIFALVTAFMGFSAACQAMENCPSIKKIEEVGSGVYRAEGENGEWSGVRQGVVAKKTSVRSFEIAIAIQENASAPQKFQHCSYGVGNRNTLDMRFIPANEKELSIDTEGDAWKKEEGAFGLIYNVCEKTAPENCKFTSHQ